uniref:Uncharacterized protein n=1 Tax=Peromyscus maniculatus bairdii TaxID=230844 RepID=A0A8C8W8L7_PERMB
MNQYRCTYILRKTREPGHFYTIYLASDTVSVTQENSQFRMLMREVKFFKNYTFMSMTFYVRKNGRCQLHTAWADKSPFQFCLRLCEYLWLKIVGVI